MAENEGKTVDGAQNCKNYSVPVAEHLREAADGRGVYKVVHSLVNQTLEYIINDGRNFDTVGKKMIAELERGQAANRRCEKEYEEDGSSANRRFEKAREGDGSSANRRFEKVCEGDGSQGESEAC